MKENSQSVMLPQSGAILPAGQNEDAHYSVCMGCTVCDSGEFDEWLSLFVED